MGGRSGPRARQILGPRSRRATEGVRKGLEKKSSQAVAEATVQAVATANPTVATLYAAYQVASFTYPIVKEGAREYARTGDKDMAVEKMKKKTVEKVKEKVVESTVEAVVGTAVDGALRETHTTVDQTAKTFVESAVSQAISEVLE